MPQNDLRDTLFYTLEKSIKAYRQFAQARVSDAGIDITIDQWLVLKILQENPDITLQQVGLMVFKDFASVTRIVQLLVAKGFVRRARHAEDGRRSSLTLTGAGDKAIARLQSIIVGNRRHALRGIAPAEITKARKLLEGIVANCQQGQRS